MVWIFISLIRMSPSYIHLLIKTSIHLSMHLLHAVVLRPLIRILVVVLNGEVTSLIATLQRQIFMDMVLIVLVQ